MATLLLPNEILSMPAAAARRLIEAGDGDCALLYLALLDHGGEDVRAAKALGWTADRLNRAWAGLTKLALAQGPPRPEPEAPPPPDRPPEYSRGDVIDAMEREADFMGLYQEVQRRLNRPLSDNDLKCLYTMYDHLALPPGVILLLTGFAARQAQRRGGGPVRLPQVQKLAFAWKRRGVDTVERAEEYLRQEQQIDQREWEILSAVGVTQRRAAVEREREFIAQWVGLELSTDLIRMAYERTVYQKGAMNWPYMNKILLSWHQQGWRTPEQVRAGDKPGAKGRPGTRKPPAQADFQPSAERRRRNDDWLDAFLEQQKEGG